MLPTVTVIHPLCGACQNSTQHDGESFWCDVCGLDYGDGTRDTPATFRDEDEAPCGVACGNQWHNGPDPHDCTPCQLPAGHMSVHWTACAPRRES